MPGITSAAASPSSDISDRAKSRSPRPVLGMKSVSGSKAGVVLVVLTVNARS
jgi:hypothetical protein